MFFLLCANPSGKTTYVRVFTCSFLTELRVKSAPSFNRYVYVYIYIHVIIILHSSTYMMLSQDVS